MSECDRVRPAMGEDNTKLTLRNFSIGIIKGCEFDFDMILRPPALAIAK